MNMMTAETLSIATITVAVITIITAITAAGRKGWKALRAGQPRQSRYVGYRRQPMRGAGIAPPATPIRPQYLPALARAQILRAQIPHARAVRPRLSEVRAGRMPV